MPPTTQSLRFNHHLSLAPAYSGGMTTMPLPSDAMRPIGTPYANSPAPPVRVLLRRLPTGTSEESLRLMFFWSKDVASVEVIRTSGHTDEGFCSAIVKFNTLEAAMEAKNKLDGRTNPENNADMIVELLPTSPTGSNNYTADRSPPSPNATVSPTATTSMASSANYGPRRMISTSPPRPPDGMGLFANPLDGDRLPLNGYAHASAHEVFPRSAMGDNFRDGTRISGKSLIENNSTDDDDTTALLRNPLAYAENGTQSGPSTHGRRATAPQIPIAQFERLSVNTSIPPSSTSVPSPYGNQMSAYVNGASPFHTINHHYHNQGYPGSAGPPPPFRAHPPINPADQNPPCNTLYVGNLPVETSEEELKAVFSKQRGYKRLCFRTKHNGPMCFVEFEDVSHATRTLHELYGHMLHNSVKGGIRLSFSKNPLGVRSQHNSVANHAGAMGAMNGTANGTANGFITASGPPPGLRAPPGFRGGLN